MSDALGNYLLFGQRKSVERLVGKTLEEWKVSAGIFNVVAVLDALDLLDRDKVRELLRENPEEVLSEQDGDGPTHWVRWAY